MSIKFGTDGWRAVISEEFTFANVRIVAQAVCDYLLSHKLEKKPLIVGYDPRFLADKFAEEVVKVAEKNGITCMLPERDTPTPVIAFEVKDRSAAGAVMLTASHNPPQYCGIKFIPKYAGPASAEITSELERNINSPKPGGAARKRGGVERFDPRERYFKYLEGIVDSGVIRQAKLKVVYDPMHGCGRGYVDNLLERFGVKVEVINGERDVLFGKKIPEPVEENLEKLKEKVLETKAAMGLANDGDADRFGLIGEDGRFYSANEVVSMVAMYLIEDKGYRGSIVRSVATTHMLDKIAALHKIKLHETPVGFKHIAEKMMKESVIIGGEESGGLSIFGHIPEKDGILANLLIVEMVAKKKKPLSAIFSELEKKVGRHLSKRINAHLPEEKKRSLISSLKEKSPGKFAGEEIADKRIIDGIKLILADGSWVLFRPSGTEPLMRVYLESGSEARLKAMEGEVARLIGE
jgi:alpha-D-glucose phosphate-specific phosphoglucomutase